MKNVVFGSASVKAVPRAHLFTSYFLVALEKYA